MNGIQSQLVSLLSLTMISKLFTFLWNTLLIRQLTPAERGNIWKVEMFILGVCTLSTEGWRRMAMKGRIWTMEYILWACGVCVFVWWMEFWPNEALQGNRVICWVGLFLELISEPFYQYVYCVHGWYRVRLLVEGVAFVVKSLLPVAFVMVWGIEAMKAVLIGQVGYGMTLLLGYGLYRVVFRDSKRMDVDQRHTESFTLLLWTNVQAVLKFLLSSGENYLLLTFRTLNDQGVYDVVSRLGSLVARIIFKNCEEVGLSQWSNLLQKKEYIRSRDLLIRLVKILSSFGLSIMIFGPSYSKSMLYLLYGQKWIETNAPFILSIYCVYIYFMALNGILEAFVSAASSSKQVKAYNGWMIVFSIVYVLLNFVFLGFLKLGTEFMIFANCLSMAFRIIYSSIFIEKYFSSLKIKFSTIESIFPHRFVLVVLIVSGLACKFSEYYVSQLRYGLLIHMTIGVGCFGLYVLSFGYFEYNPVRLRMTESKKHD